MNFTFSPQSKLQGRVVHQPFDRFSYIPKSEEGLTEYIFCYATRVPSETEEPELYRGARVSAENPEEVTLRYDGLDEVVLLLTIAADNRYREEHADLVAQNEAFRIDR